MKTKLAIRLETAIAKKYGRTPTGLHVQESGDGCSPRGQRLAFIDDTPENASLTGWRKSPTQGSLVRQFGPSSTRWF